jgi:UDP-N-acetylglucosamine 4,6-dehydratase/5-epimerase
MTFNNKTILVTGGTGSFGKMFVLSVFKKFKPKKIIIFSRDELKQYEMADKFKKFNNKLRFFIGDIRDKDRLDLAMHGVDYVVHAAALKHVPIAEYNPMECIKTNINGAENIIQVCTKHNVKKIIALSTDKACSPINLYGATKLVSDKLFIAANNIVGGKNIKFSVVRYGNVFNSRGSVIPHFLKLLKSNKKTIPITDKNMTRFHITLSEGVDFVLKSFERMSGGEIFIPKIPSLKVTDIAKAIMPDCKIDIIGIRPGEKLHEIMFSSENARSTIEFNDYFVITPEIQFSNNNISYLKNPINEKGKRVKKNLSYSSDTNDNFLSVSEIKKLIKAINTNDTV